MMDKTMTLPFVAENLQNFAENLQGSKERFVKLCLKFDSARSLADELALIGHDVSERKCANWRSRNFKRVFYVDVQAVKYAFQAMKLREANALAAELKEAQML